MPVKLLIIGDDALNAIKRELREIELTHSSGVSNNNFKAIWEIIAGTIWNNDYEIFSKHYIEETKDLIKRLQGSD